MFKRYIPTLILVAASLPVMAQYDQDISVEGKYVPEFIPRDRIGLFPRPVKFPADKSTLSYSLNGVNADFVPQAIPIPAIGWNDTRSYSTARGYVDLGLGSWLESTFSAGYRFIDTRTTTVGIRLQHNSTSLWKPEISTATVDTRMWRYDESLGIYGSHIFDGRGRLDAAIDYHIGNFNYYGYAPYITNISTLGSVDAPTQTLNDVSAHVGWSSPAALDNITWHAAAGAHYFGYRRYYLPDVSGIDPQALTGGRETHVNIDGGVNFPTSTKSSLGIDLGADILSYGGYESRGSFSPVGDAFDAPDTYGMVSLTPYYRFNRSRLDIRVGARIDLSFNAGTEENRYKTFHIAPDVTLDYNSGPVAIYLHLLGGSRLNTLANGYEQDYYQASALFETRPIYTPLDAEFGASFGPFSGFHAGLRVAWRASRNEKMGGLYQLFLNHANPDGLDFVTESDDHEFTYDYSPENFYNISGFSFGINMGYDAGRYFKIDAEGTYQPQDGKKGYFNGFDRPRWTANATLTTNPWSTLKFSIGFDYRGDRAYAMQSYNAGSTPLNGGPVVMCAIPDLMSLNIGVSYGITDNFNVWIQGDNLLNRTNWYGLALPEPGIRLAAGFGITF